METYDSEVRAIREIIHRQFGSMTWRAGESPDLARFREDFSAEARLYPSARPVAGRSIEEFGARMSELACTSLASFHERVIGTKVHVFGSVAVAVVACENTENDRDVNRNVEMMLLVKDDCRWKIVAQAWDREMPGQVIPAELLGVA